MKQMTDKEKVDIKRQTICKGCRIYVLHRDCNFLPVIHKGSDKEFVCPCSTCLVKMMCLSDTNCKRATLYGKMMLPIKERMDDTLRKGVTLQHSVLDNEGV